MAMFATLATIALATMAFTSLPDSGSVEPHVAAPYGGKADSKTSRLPASVRPKTACAGLAWGAETPECLRQIAIESGREPATDIRIVAAGEIDHQRPNIY